MATFAEHATLNTYTYDSDGFKRDLNVGGSLTTIIWDGSDYVQGSTTHPKEVPKSWEVCASRLNDTLVQIERNVPRDLALLPYNVGRLDHGGLGCL
jgi:hypothetical protein